MKENFGAASHFKATKPTVQTQYGRGRNSNRGFTTASRGTAPTAIKIGGSLNNGAKSSNELSSRQIPKKSGTLPRPSVGDEDSGKNERCSIDSLQLSGKKNYSPDPPSRGWIHDQPKPEHGRENNPRIDSRKANDASTDISEKSTKSPHMEKIFGRMKTPPAGSARRKKPIQTKTTTLEMSAPEKRQHVEPTRPSQSKKLKGGSPVPKKPQVVELFSDSEAEEDSCDIVASCDAAARKLANSLMNRQDERELKQLKSNACVSSSDVHVPLQQAALAICPLFLLSTPTDLYSTISKDDKVDFYHHCADKPGRRKSHSPELVPVDGIAIGTTVFDTTKKGVEGTHHICKELFSQDNSQGKN